MWGNDDAPSGDKYRLLLEAGLVPKPPISTWLAMLRDRDIHIRAHGDQLRCSAPTGVLTPALREELQQRKPEIVQFLHSAAALAREQRSVIPLQPGGARAPVFAVAGHNGDVFCYRALAERLGENQPFFGLQPPGLDSQSEPLTRVEDLAAYFAGQIRAFHPRGPCVVAGFCAGGGIAFELARQLMGAGAEVRLLALFGSPFPTWYRFLPQLRYRLRDQVDRVARHLGRLGALSFPEQRAYLAERWRNRKAQRASERSAEQDPVLAQRGRLARATVAAVRRYRPGDFSGRVCLFLPGNLWPCRRDALLHWRSVVPVLEEYVGPEGCTGDTMLRDPYAPALAALFNQCCARFR
jgi:thioesterase domain-containing protein